LGKNENFKQLKSMGYKFWLLFPLSPPEFVLAMPGIAAETPIEPRFSGVFCCL